MAEIDISKIKPGDEVTVRAIVKQLGPNYLTLKARMDCFSIEPDAIVSHTPKALAVGDRVKATNWGGFKFEILAIDGNWAWLKDPGGSHIQLPLLDLERLQ